MSHAHAARRGSVIRLLLALVTLLCCGEHAGAAEPPAGELALKRVVLFSSGVGFFEQQGQIEGDRRVDLRFNVDQINDLLKSLVLQDLDGGTVSSVAYDSKDPAARTLKTFSIDLTGEPNLAALLRQVRGERVQLDTGALVTGTIVGIERRRVRAAKDEALEVDFVNLLTDSGLKSVALDNVAEIRLLNQKLNSDLQQALAVLAAAHAADKKTITLDFQGKGKRRVRVGYINESPIWKTSYRLVLEDDDPPFLQGWAIVENTTEQDWRDVALTLVSGRPVSFVMDLYQPLYLDRPVVVPEMFAGLSPRTHDQDLAAKDAQFRALADTDLSRRKHASGGAMGGMGGGMGGGSFGGPAKKPTEDIGISTAVQLPDFASTSQPAVSASDVGELFRYSISKPVTIDRQRSAMLPIVDESIKGEKLAIYNPQTDAKHPLNGLKFTNTSGLHLMQGPITVFDGGEYAGDARIEDVAPGASRLISYALDLDTEISSDRQPHPRTMESVRIAKGAVSTQYKLTRTQKYVVKNSGKRTKKVLIEQFRETNWKLVAPKEPAEQTRGWNRFALSAVPGNPAALAVEEEQILIEQVSLSNLPDDTIALYQASNAVSPAVKDALAEMLQRKAALAKVSTERQAAMDRLDVIASEQDRIRQNMQVLDRQSDLYQKYVKEFSQQEDDIKKLRQEASLLTTQETVLKQGLDAFLTSLDVR